MMVTHSLRDWAVEGVGGTTTDPSGSGKVCNLSKSFVAWFCEQSGPGSRACDSQTQYVRRQSPWKGTSAQHCQLPRDEGCHLALLALPSGQLKSLLALPGTSLLSRQSGKRAVLGPSQSFSRAGCHTDGKGRKREASLVCKTENVPSRTKQGHKVQSCSRGWASSLPQQRQRPCPKPPQPGENTRIPSSDAKFQKYNFSC